MVLNSGDYGGHDARKHLAHSWPLNWALTPAMTEERARVFGMYFFNEGQPALLSKQPSAVELGIIFQGETCRRNETRGYARPGVALSFMLMKQASSSCI
jgi:hypothetical protein